MKKHTTKFQRFAPGLYVDPTERYVISRDGRGYYTIRPFLRYGTCLDGVTVMPDYSDIILSDCATIAECKATIQLWDAQ
jgi:hypothetical protein